MPDTGNLLAAEAGRPGRRTAEPTTGAARCATTAAASAQPLPSRIRRTVRLRRSTAAPPCGAEAPLTPSRVRASQITITGSEDVATRPADGRATWRRRRDADAEPSPRVYIDGECAADSGAPASRRPLGLARRTRGQHRRPGRRPISLATRAVRARLHRRRLRRRFRCPRVAPPTGACATHAGAT